MANPQLEDGYVRIANEFFDALCRVRFPGETTLVLNFIIRKTYGFGKKSDAIPLSQFAEGTKLSKPHICHAIKLLCEMNVIVAEKGNGITNYMINKDFDTWRPLPKKATLPKSAKVVAELGNNRCRIGDTQKTKDNTKDNCGKSAAKPPHPAMMFLTDFGKLFKTRFGTTYVANFKKDVQLVKGMLSAIEYDDLLNRAGQFLRDEDDFIKNKAGYTIGTFSSKVNKYVVKKPVEVKGYQPEIRTPEQEQAAEIARQDAMKKLREQGVLR